MPKKGEKAPDFTLEDDAGERVSLNDFAGKTVVLYFYPKDDTPGCTAEACGFRDAYDEILALGAVVLGVSPDPAVRHRRFKDRYALPFRLLADVDHSVLLLYGAWGEKKLYGKAYEGVLRSTYVIAPDGTIIGAFPKVTPKEHAAEIIALLRGGT